MIKKCALLALFLLSSCGSDDDYHSGRYRNSHWRDHDHHHDDHHGGDGGHHGGGDGGHGGGGHGGGKSH